MAEATCHSLKDSSAARCPVWGRTIKERREDECECVADRRGPRALPLLDFSLSHFPLSLGSSPRYCFFLLHAINPPPAARLGLAEHALPPLPPPFSCPLLRDLRAAEPLSLEAMHGMIAVGPPPPQRHLQRLEGRRRGR